MQKKIYLCVCVLVVEITNCNNKLVTIRKRTTVLHASPVYACVAWWQRWVELVHMAASPLSLVAVAAAAASVLSDAESIPCLLSAAANRSRSSVLRKRTGAPNWVVERCRKRSWSGRWGRKREGLAKVEKWGGDWTGCGEGGER